MTTRLADFTRLAWVSDEARAVWGPRLRAIGQAWQEVEWRSVACQLRRAALQVVPAAQMPTLGQTVAARGLLALPLALHGVARCTYSATPVAFEPGQPCDVRVVVAEPEDALAFREVFQSGDDEAIGSLLGFPPCCRAFFQRHWVEQESVDTTWAMVSHSEEEGIIEVDGPAEANPLLRWLGARAVPHLPCSFHCAATAELGCRLLQVMHDAGFIEESVHLRTMLSWPAEWSSRHGIAEIRTPIIKLVTRTDRHRGRRVVRRLGSAYPEEGAAGLAFPYRAPALRATGGRAVLHRGLANPLRRVETPPPWYHLDNGFSSRYAMDEAHRAIVAATAAAGFDSGSILDLGCGNGALLRKIVEARPGTVPYGIDGIAERIDHARRLLPAYSENFFTGDIFGDDEERLWSRSYDLILVMPGRLLEAPAERADRLRQRIRERSHAVLVYAYGDWRVRYGHVHGLASAAGFGDSEAIVVG